DDYFENRNPADWNDLIGLFPKSGPEDVRRAVESARRGFAAWSRTPAPVRGEVLHRVGDLLVEHKDRIARAMTREMGKVVLETKGDVQEGIDTAYYAHTEGRRLFGRTVPSELRNKWAMSYRRPIGVAGVITPFNFPLAVPTWKLFPALLCGNAVIWKPSEDVPHTANLLVEVLLEAGLPPEVIQVVHGLGEAAGQALVEHPGVDAISFTGSTETGAIIGATCGRMHKRASLEMGGKNEMIEAATGGATPAGKAFECGWFYRPTVLTGVKPGMRVEQEEIFGPVLSVIRVGSLDEAIRVNNDVAYGLSSSIYTRNVNAAFRAMQDLDNGITYVNAPTIGAEAHLPFGGVKQTGNGHREGGWEVYDFYSETQVVDVDYSGKLQRAQIDTEG